MALIRMGSRILNKMSMFSPVVNRKIWTNYSEEMYVQTKRFLATETRSKIVDAPMLSAPGSVYQTSLGSDYLEIKTSNQQMKFHLIWLRDHCRCSSCFNDQSKQRLIDPVKISPDTSVSDFDISDGKLTITWDDGHITSFQMDWLSKIYNVSHTGEEDKHRILWDRERLETYLPSDVTFDEYMGSEEGLIRLLTNMHTFGIAFISGIPKSRAMTRVIGERVAAPLKCSVFGDIDFSPENAELRKDLSFGTGYLPYHTDYASHHDPPGYQFMHYLQQAEVGGETFFCDALRAARILKEHHPDDFNALATLPVAFHKVDNGMFVRTETTVFEVRGPSQDPIIIRASNDDRSVLPLGHDDAKRWYKAWRKFRQITDDPKNTYYVKAMPGRGIFVDNWRLMHGRLAFKGARALEVCNLSRDRVASKLSTCANIGSDVLI